MHATMSHYRPADAGRPIRGTFYPSDSPGGAPAAAGVLPKILGVVIALFVLRTVARAASRGHGGASRWSRRREAIAELHRELHAREAGAQGTTSADEAVKA